MAEITATLVKQLRERTGAAMMDCKRALDATDGDVEAAAEKMRVEGQAKADKKASRVAAEGVIGVAVSDQAIVMVEVNCETDFVAKGDDFQGFANDIARLALANPQADVAALMELQDGGESLDARRRALVARLGENIAVRRLARVAAAGGGLSYYLHGARIGVAVSMSAGDEALARDLAMHIAASRPQYLDMQAVPAEAIESERRVIEAQSAEQSAGKPPEIVARMIDGKLRKFLAEVTLLGQPFVKDPDQTVEKLLKSRQAQVASFVRLEVGEGIDKQQGDFAAEVMAQAQAQASRG
jgi:translation elongation factor Ts (EF-Ts)